MARAAAPTVVRPLRESDLEGLAALFTQSVHVLAAGHYDATQRFAWAPQEFDLDTWRRRFAPLSTLLAERDSELAGFIAYEQNGHIEFLYTSPRHARRGVASSLFARAERALAALSVRELTTEASLVARPFFERQGFEVTEEQVVRRGDAYLRRYAMRKKL